MITYLEKRKSISQEETKEPDHSLPLPSVSIIIPCFNEGKTILGTVQSLLHLDYPKEKIKILIVDDGSTDDTLSVLKKYENDSTIKIFHKENGGKHTALNFGLERVTSELVGCLDADSYVEKGALKKIVTYFEDKTAMAVTPSIRVHNAQNILERIQNIEYNYGSFVRKVFSQINGLYVIPGPFSIFRKKVFDTLGNYKTAHQTEDIEIALRMQNNKYRIVNCHKAYIDTVTPKTLRTLYKQRLRWTYGFIRNAFDYRSMFFNKKHGHLGMFILPLAPFYILSALYLVFSIVYNFSYKIADYITKIKVTGIDLKWPDMTFSWYFINTDTKIFLLIVSFALLCTIIVLGHRLTGQKIKILDFVYTFFLYGLISPSWLIMSIGKAVLRRKIGWR